MRLINLRGRPCLQVGESEAVDVSTASQGAFPPVFQAIYEDWDRFVKWASTGRIDAGTTEVTSFRPDELGPPAPHPGQVFAIGLNYSDHAAESGFAKPAAPVVFTKWASSFSGPYSQVVLPEGSVDWEVELVVVLGRGGRDIAEADAWGHVAGLSVGQDLSERVRQHAGPAPQFGLAKSHAGFSPMGPALVTLDELEAPDDLDIVAEIDGEKVQVGRTSQMIFSVPDLIHRLSEVVALLPGDVIFTGTPSGVGAGRTPTRFLKPGETLRSRIGGIGELVQTFVAADDTVAKG